MIENLGVVESVTATVTRGSVARFTLFDMLVIPIMLISLYFLIRFAARRNKWPRNI